MLNVAGGFAGVADPPDPLSEVLDGGLLFGWHLVRFHVVGVLEACAELLLQAAPAAVGPSHRSALASGPGQQVVLPKALRCRCRTI